jgi:ABC-type cobalamin/Fe3+-siderophores transport system ATPase subunit
MARYVGYVPQFCNIPFAYTVKDVMVAGRYAQIKGRSVPGVKDYKKVNQVLKELDILKLKHKTINQLSGGEKQMVMIGRALVQEPKILLMDEPSASLDFGNTYKIISKIKALADKNIGVVMTTHSPKIASLCADKVLMLKNQKVYQYGTLNHVMKDDKLVHLYDLENEEALELCGGL